MRFKQPLLFSNFTVGKHNQNNFATSNTNFTVKVKAEIWLDRDEPGELAPSDGRN